ncbi:Conserved_hypothetical protein [Hexamita inflata]|uniref:Uncharacterized protein n=1 Tax=Hexamita inflata TaxID=28002 RepID=A0AA86P0X6_9EUKA|nr:Conserved hypothetical protein [Hexamita inflata]
MPPKQFSQQFDNQTQELANQQFFTSFLNTDLDTDAAGVGKDSTQMYIEAAANVLNSISSWDPGAANTLKVVIDYLVSDARLKPYELDQQKQIAKEAVQQTNDLQVKLQKISLLNLNQNQQISQQKQKIDQQSTTIIQNDYDIQKYVATIEQSNKDIKKLQEQLSATIYEQLDIKNERDSAVRRQNIMAAQQIEFRALYEQLLINKQELQIKFEKVVTRETDLRQNLALRDAEYEEAKIIIKKTQDELIAVKNALENHQSIYEEEKMIMNKKFEALQSERNQLLVQNQVYSDQAYKISSNVNQKQRIIDKLQDQLTQLNYQLAKANQQPVVEYRVPTPIQTVDFQCQVTNSIKLLDKEKFYEVLLDPNTPIDEVLECIDAEMSQTSQEFSFNDNMKDITERDNYDMLLKKIQAKFVSKLQFEQMKALNQQMKQKYIKYKQKYTVVGPRNAFLNQEEE